MKKFSKIMVFILMLAVSIASFAISPALGIVMASGTGLVGASIALTKMPTKGEVNKACKQCSICKRWLLRWLQRGI